MDGVEHHKGTIHIELSPEDARWLAGELPWNDGFTRDIWTACDEADRWLVVQAEIKAEMPRVRFVIEMRE